MKIKFNMDDELPLNKTVEILSMVIFVTAIFYENRKYYSQVFLDEYLYKLHRRTQKARSYHEKTMKLLYFTCIIDSC